MSDPPGLSRRNRESPFCCLAPRQYLLDEPFEADPAGYGQVRYTAFADRMDYSDRLRSETFVDDEPVGVAAALAEIPAESIPEAEWVFVSERLFDRLLLLGQAYDLHFGAIVGAKSNTVLNTIQAESFAEELQFLERLIPDPALRLFLSKIMPKVQAVARNSGMTLTVSRS